MKLLILALLVGVCYSAPAAPEMSAGFGTVEQGPEKVENNTLAHWCQPHATRQHCSSGCPPTCQHPQSMCMVMICDNRCVCNQGFVLDGDEKCVPLADCEDYDPDEQLGFDNDQDLHEVAADSIEPGVTEDSEPEDTIEPVNQGQKTNTCTANQIFTECGTACPKTCANPDGSLMCVDMCVIGCQCAEGYLLASDKSCVKADGCY